MFAHKSVRQILALTFTLLLVLPQLALAAGEQGAQQKTLPNGTPVLWQAPKDIASRNLYHGPGGAGLRPNLRKITFIEEEGGGYSTKFRVRDASGREWVAKVGKEAQSETAAVRLLWAAGYMTEINYLAPSVTIPGKGSFENVRFEARPKNVTRLNEWSWEKNPFVGTREFQGLKVMMVLLNNWDIKDSNNQILFVPNAVRRRGGGASSGQLQYVISDLGATFGKTGGLPVLWRITRSRSKAEDYEKAKFIDGVKDGYVDFHYGGKNREMFDKIRVADARWIGQILSRLSDRQISDAFRAANYNAEEVQTLTEAVRERIRGLANLAG